MVGNDIIDIAKTQRTTNWERPGFLNKIFTAEEQAYIMKSENSFITVWRLWSMKESAYKVYVQAGSERFFKPTALECKLDNSTSTSDFKEGTVKMGKMELKTVSSLNQNYIFTSASSSNSKIATAILALERATVKEQSNFIHQQLLDVMAKENNLNRKALCLTKNKNGVPTLLYRNESLKHSISITHHGLYGAYSITSV
jgi:phosphopantetheinyl transferase (holo-ACP synthase)